MKAGALNSKKKPGLARPGCGIAWNYFFLVFCLP